MWKYILAANLLALVWGVVLFLGLHIGIALLATLMIGMTVAALVVQQRMAASKGAEQLEKALVAQGAAAPKDMRPDQCVEIEEMRNQFSRELGALKGSKLGGGRAALYSLPWYVIIGPPGAGKTTALQSSGLTFPGKKGRIKGIGGTRNCDWWLSNEAVILDTAGRYATQDEDHDEWLAFLDIIKKNRKDKPINGLIVAVSVTDLGGKSDRDIEKLSERIRGRLDEVLRHLQMVVPVYLMITKCDLLPGFVDTFGGMRKSDRSQIWGVTLPFAVSAAPSEPLGEGLHELAEVLRQRSMVRLAEDRRQNLRDRVYQFPQQFEALRGQLLHFVEETFAPNAYEETPRLRGVYFTSGTQEGRPIDLLASSMAQAFGLSTGGGTVAPADPKSYFLRDVFARVMFPDQSVAGRTAKGRRAVAIRRYGIGGAALAAAALVVVLPLGAYRHNRGIVTSTGEIVEAVVAERQQNRNQVVPPASIESLRARLSQLEAWQADAPPMAMRFGMYQGGAIYPQLNRFYIQMLQRELLQPMLQHDVEQMRTMRQVYGFHARPSDEEYARFFDKLKTHLLLTAPKAAGEPSFEDEKAWLVEQLTRRWGGALGHPIDAATRKQMSAHIAFYLEQLGKSPQMMIARDDEAVRDARAVLTRLPYEQAILRRIVAEASVPERELNLRRVMNGATTPLLSDRNTVVRAAFTRWGWENGVRERLQSKEIQADKWVYGLGGGVGADMKFKEQLEAAYFDAYIVEWKTFLDALRVRQPSDSTDMLQQLRELTRGDPPPLKQLLRTVAENTRLPDPDAEAAAKAGDLAGKVGKKALGRAGKAGRAVAQNAGDFGFDGPETASAALAAAFDELVAFGWAPPTGGGSSPTLPLDLYQEQLVYLRDGVQAFTDSGKAADVLSRVQSARTAVRGMLEQMPSGSGWRPRIESLLWPPVENISESLVAIRSDVGRNWCSAVVSPYVRALEGRYPLAGRGPDSTLADFSAFFGPGGTLWSFYQSELRSDVQQTGSRFTFDNRMGGILQRAYQPQLLEYLRRTYSVTSALFPPGASLPQMDLDVRVRASPAFGLIALEVGTDAIEYRGGPELWRRVSWPGSDPGKGARLRVKGRGGVEDAIAFAGEWGFFRLLEEAQVKAQSSLAIQLEWQLKRQPGTVTIEIRPTGAQTSLLRKVRTGRGKQLNLTFGSLQPPRVIARGSPECIP